jgi:heme-degrading monooxygenase HmoA
VIARLWRGRAPHETADAYIEHLERDTLPRLRSIAGHRGAYVLRRDLAGDVEFLVLTLWESLAAIRAFAGDDYETAVVPPEARPLLSSFDETVDHLEVAVDTT